MSRFLRAFKDFFLPTRDNAYRPGIFSVRSVLAIVAILLFAQVGYFAVTTLVFHRTNFLAAVLPGVLTSLTNADRATTGLPQLSENALLAEAAQNKANDMAAKGYFSHVTPDGKTPWYWLDQAGYDYTYAGENLAVDFTDSKDVENAWMASPTHHANIVKPQYTQIGIAVAEGTYQGQPATFVVQFFGTPAEALAKGPVVAKAAPAPAKTPVVAAAPASSTVAVAPVGEPESVLGTTTVTGQSQPNAPEVENNPDFFAALLASPTHTMLYVIGGLLSLISLLLFLAIFVEIRIQYVGVIGGGALVLAVAAGMFFITQTHLDRVSLPADTTPASVYVGFNAAR